MQCRCVVPPVLPAPRKVRTKKCHGRDGDVLRCSACRIPSGGGNPSRPALTCVDMNGDEPLASGGTYSQCEGTMEPMVGVEPTAFPVPTGCASGRATPAHAEYPSWRRQQDSNLRPPGSKPGTLFAELWRREHRDGAGERSRTPVCAVRKRCSAVELRRPGGPERLRSSDLPLAGRALSWLSYGPGWCRRHDSNVRPLASQTSALFAELRRHGVACRG